MNRRLLCAILALSLAALACIVSVETVVRDDESGTVTVTIEVSEADTEDLDDVTCELDESLPPESTMERHVSGDTVTCILTIPFEDPEGLRQAYAALGEENIEVGCLAFQADRLIYDLTIIPGDGESAPSDLVIPWQLTVPGRITDHNADEQSGQTLTWNLPASGGQRSLQLNVTEDGTCPTDLFLVQLAVWEDGTGTAIIRSPTLPTGSEDTQYLTSLLRDVGWQVEEPARGAASFEARRPWESEAEFQAIAAAIPPLAGSATEFNLSLLEDPATGLLQFDFRGRLDFQGYLGFWDSINPDLEPPPFRLDYLAPGTVDSVSGDWSDNILLERSWSPEEERSSFPLRAITKIEPLLEQEVSETEAEANLEIIKDGFLDEIQPGQILQDPSLIQSALMTVFSAGTANNMTNWTEYACGDYQTKVLAWLDAIRTNADESVRSRLGGLDYGPVQAYRGGHQAVVVFPRGTDWRETGTVLDPWPNQRPEVYTMDQWTDRFSWGHGVGEGGDRYPHLYGNSPSYPSTTVPRERLHPRRIGVNSPVAALVIDSEGRRLGMLDDGTFVNEIVGADFYPTAKGEGEFQWYFGLPEGDYTLTLRGTGSGDTHLIVGDENNELVTYGPQEIGTGQEALLTISAVDTDRPLELPSGEQVDPIAVTEGNVESLDFGQGTAPPSAETALPAPSLRFAYLALLLLCIGGPVGAVWLSLTARRSAPR